MFMSSTYPVDAVGVADSWDGFGLWVGGQDWDSAEAAVVSTSLFPFLVRGAARLDVKVGPLHRVMDASGEFPVPSPTAVHHRDAEWSAVFTIPAGAKHHQNTVNPHKLFQHVSLLSRRRDANHQGSN